MEEIVGSIIVAVGAVHEMESSDSSDSDLENNIIPYLYHRVVKNKPRIANYIDNVVALYCEKEFKQHFRMTRETFNFLLHTIALPLSMWKNDDMHGTKDGRSPISAEKQLLVVIWVFATPDSYRSVCDRFDIGRATAIRAVRRVTNALVQIAPQFIKWPDVNEVRHNSTIFEAQKGIPNILGAIDGTHIKIAAPKENPEGYINRKGFHSIQLQIVCDSSMKLLHCYVGQPGSVHDQRIFSLSDVQDFCINHEKFPGDTHLIGDAAYAIQQHLLVPYRNNGHLTLQQKNFNYCLSATRMIVERSIGLLKGRFRSLLDKLPMTRTDLIPNYIMACCVLHNICLKRNDMIEIPTLVRNNENEYVQPVNQLLRNEGVQKRNRITNNLEIRLIDE